MGKALRVLVGVGCIAAALGLGACAREVADGEGDEENNASNNSGQNNGDNNDLPPDIEVTGDPIGTTYGQGRFTKASAGLCSWNFRTVDANGTRTDDGYCTSDAECSRFGEGLSCDPFTERCAAPCDRHAECDDANKYPILDTFDPGFEPECDPYPEAPGVCTDAEQSPCFEGQPACPEGSYCQVQPVDG